MQRPVFIPVVILQNVIHLIEFESHLTVTENNPFETSWHNTFFLILYFACGKQAMINMSISAALLYLAPFIVYHLNI